MRGTETYPTNFKRQRRPQNSVSTFIIFLPKGFMVSAISIAFHGSSSAQYKYTNYPCACMATVYLVSAYEKHDFNLMCTSLFALGRGLVWANYRRKAELFDKF